MKPERTQAEIRQLFGDLIVMQAQQTDPADLKPSAELMDRVHDGADALLARRGNVPEQQQYIRELPHKIRLTLCMWLLDTNMAAKLVRAAYAVSSQVCR